MAVTSHAPVVVVGGANTDISGFADAALVARDSNPGRVRVSAGGVGRNIAENLARLGLSTRLVTALGEGHEAMVLAKECRAAGIDLVDVPAQGLPGSRYLSIMDVDGDMALAVSDMRALDAITPDAVDAHASALDSARLIVLDTNLPAVTIEHIAARWGSRPIIADTVSVAKAGRVSRVLDLLHTLRCNAAEAATLTGMSDASIEEMAHALVEAGAPRVIVTAGPAGAVAAYPGGSLRFVPPHVAPTNATGAGDAFTAGVVYSVLEGLDTTHTLAFSSAMAMHALASPDTVARDVDEAATREAMEAMLS
ncbi:MAG: carbohydrate kinase family protein [Actinomycetia bacterium]|nr:carbohydrate kinase family protein [Actinomycetes bacterium]